MHIALINIFADAIAIGMEARVANAPIPGVQILAGPVGAYPGDHCALVDVRAVVVLARTVGTKRLVVPGAYLWASFAG